MHVFVKILMIPNDPQRGEAAASKEARGASGSGSDFGTVGSAPPPRRPTPTVRAPTIRRRTAEGADAENSAPSGADNKFRIARVRTGTATLAGDGNALGVPAAVGASATFGGANSLLAKFRPGIAANLTGGRNSPLLGSPLRAASPQVVWEGGGANFAVPTPPRDDASRPGSAARRAPIRPVPMAVVPPAE